MEQNKVSILDKLKERAKNPNRNRDAGIVNSTNGSSAVINGSGDIILASSKNSQYKMKKAKGSSSEITYQSNTITVRKNIEADDVILNKHKLNPQLHELTDQVELFGDKNLSIGNLTMNGYVLVKAWEPFLKKWVLIRRPMRTPLFFDKINIAGAIPNTSSDDNIKEEIKDMTESEKRRL